MTIATPPSLWARLLRRPTAVLALAWLCLLLVVAALAGQLSAHDPLEQELLAIKQGPSAEYLLGTDALGRDVLSRVMHGTAPTLLGVLEAVFVAGGLGIAMGVSAGYFGGRWDRLVQQVVNLLQSMPTILIMLAVLAVFGQNMLPAMVTLGILGSAGISRVMRSVTLAVREELYIAAARLCGLGDGYIIVRHVMPRIIGPVIVQLALFCAIAVIVQTGISFLGLGVVPPAPTWGGMIFEASSSLSDHPWLLVPSGGVVALTILAFGLLGDSLRDASTENWSRPAAQQRAGKRAAEAVHDVPASSLLSLRGLCIDAGARRLVDGVSFDLAPGETLGIVGESGSGKTLSSLSLLGLLPSGTQVTAGTVVIDGQAIDLGDHTRLAQLRGATVGMIFQEPMSALDPCFTIGYQLAEVVRLQHAGSLAEVHARVIGLLEAVKIRNPEEVAQRYPHQISGGMAQRVGIARALAREPRVLLADEPTTALDVTVQAEILSLLRQLARARGMAVILVTHDWGVVADLCDRALVMRHGRVLESADVVDLFHRPQHPYTRALLAANPHGAQPGQPLPTVAEVMAAAGMEDEGVAV